MRILLGVSGSIAAYKAALLVRLLVKRGDEVRVIMTPAATAFITPLTLATLSKNPVLSDIAGEEGWNNHVELGLWADACLIAPATAQTLAKMAGGLCDNLLSAVYLSARCPVFVAPAMDVDMWRHPATRDNLRRLHDHGVHTLPVGYGELASGLVGDGRMAEPEEIVAFLDRFFSTNKPLSGKKALVTAGPTHEPIDPVRFIGNHSTGKMGIAIAEELHRLGADVALVLGPTHLQPADSIRTIRVQTAQEMFQACDERFSNTDIAVLAAAVADYKPAAYTPEKIKKTGDAPTLSLIHTVDIAAALGARKKPGQLLVGFALETQQEETHARAKLEKKNFDFIVLNSLRDAGAGFGHDTNKITVLHRQGPAKTFDLKPKTEVAADIVAEILRSANPPAHASV